MKRSKPPKDSMYMHAPHLLGVVKLIFRLVHKHGGVCEKVTARYTSLKMADDSPAKQLLSPISVLMYTLRKVHVMSEKPRSCRKMASWFSQRDTTPPIADFNPLQLKLANFKDTSLYTSIYASLVLLLSPCKISAIYNFGTHIRHTETWTS